MSKRVQNTALHLILLTFGISSYANVPIPENPGLEARDRFLNGQPVDLESLPNQSLKGLCYQTLQNQLKKPSGVPTLEHPIADGSDLIQHRLIYLDSEKAAPIVVARIRELQGIQSSEPYRTREFLKENVREVKVEEALLGEGAEPGMNCEQLSETSVYETTAQWPLLCLDSSLRIDQARQIKKGEKIYQVSPNALSRAIASILDMDPGKMHVGEVPQDPFKMELIQHVEYPEVIGVLSKSLLTPLLYTRPTPYRDTLDIEQSQNSSNTQYLSDWRGDAGGVCLVNKNLASQIASAERNLCHAIKDRKVVFHDFITTRGIGARISSSLLRTVRHENGKVTTWADPTSLNPLSSNSIARLDFETYQRDVTALIAHNYSDDSFAEKETKAQTIVDTLINSYRIQPDGSVLARALRPDHPVNGTHSVASVANGALWDLYNWKRKDDHSRFAQFEKYLTSVRVENHFLPIQSTYIAKRAETGFKDDLSVQLPTNVVTIKLNRNNTMFFHILNRDFQVFRRSGNKLLVATLASAPFLSHPEAPQYQDLNLYRGSNFPFLLYREDTRHGDKVINDVPLLDDRSINFTLKPAQLKDQYNQLLTQIHNGSGTLCEYDLNPAH